MLGKPEVENRCVSEQLLGGQKGQQLPAGFFLAPISQWSESAPRDIHPTVSLGCVWGPSRQLPGQPELLWVQLLGEAH